MILTADQIYTFLGVTAGAGGILSLAFQGLKKSSNYLTAKETKWATVTIHVGTVLFAVIGAAAYYFIEFYNKGTFPVEILGVSTASIYGFMQVLYNISKAFAGSSIASEQSKINGLLTKASQQTSTQNQPLPVSTTAEPELLG